MSAKFYHFVDQLSMLCLLDLLLTACCDNYVSLSYYRVRQIKVAP